MAWWCGWRRSDYRIMGTAKLETGTQAQLPAKLTRGDLITRRDSVIPVVALCQHVCR
jgi:hypothetical protein